MGITRVHLLYFNPRSPCGERLNHTADGLFAGGFQSTLPVWGATPASEERMLPSSYFNPRSPCGERQIVPD